jgi:Spy/CpxP family protein refolding chaperone
MRFSRICLTGVALLLLLCAPLGAQQPGGDRPAMSHKDGGGSPMDCPMMTGAIRTPDAALRARDALELAPGQRARLEVVQRRLDSARAPAMDSMRVLHAQLAAIAQGPQLGERAARAALDRMGRVHTTMGLAMLRASHDVGAILTPAQRDSLTAIVRRQMPMRGAMSGRGMSSQPMMCPMM